MALSEATCIQARLTLRTTAEGGRQTGIKTGYRPNHVFEYTILPGETAIVTVCFLTHPDLEKYLQVGRQWYIHEWPKLLGHAEIIKI